MLSGKGKKHFITFLFFSLPIFLLLFCSGCWQEESEKLKILVDLRDVDFVSSEPENLCRAFKHRGGLDPGDLEIELLPAEEEERALRLSQLRTEIMSGKGPDVFLMTCNFSGWRSGQGVYRILAEDENEEPFQQERLFDDVESCMKNHLFLPLDEFMEDAEYFDPDTILPAVLEAGRTEEGQMVLPITFTFPVGVYQKDILPENQAMPASWQEATGASCIAAQKAYGVAAWNQFSDIFPKLTDDSRRRLGMTEDELLQRVKEAQRLSDSDLLTFIQSEADDLPKSLAYEKFINYVQEVANAPFPADRFDGFLSERSLDYFNMDYWSSGFYDYRWEEEEYSQLIEPIYNTDGGVTAGITTYACINRNTKRPEEAFRALDTLFCTDIQNGHGAAPEEYPKIDFQVLVFVHSYGIPARNDLLKNNERSFQLHYLSRLGINPGPDEELFAEYTALRNEVTHARFYGVLDEELQAMYEACLEAESDEEIEKIVSKAYSTMEKILAES